MAARDAADKSLFALGECIVVSKNRMVLLLMAGSDSMSNENLGEESMARLTCSEDSD
jgi:hypothetical protein